LVVIPVVFGADGGSSIGRYLRLIGIQLA